MPRKNTGRPHGVRLTKRQVDSTREKIRCSLLVNRLEAYVHGKAGANGKPIEMSEGQVRVALKLLDKVVPDLQRVEQVGDGGGPIQHQEIPPATMDDAGRAYVDMLSPEKKPNTETAH